MCIEKKKRQANYGLPLFLFSVFLLPASRRVPAQQNYKFSVACRLTAPSAIAFFRISFWFQVPNHQQDDARQP